MRNLKRALSLALASVMLLGMMVVGTSAASYPDVDENDNVEAIEVLNAVNVMIGRQGNFEPDEAVNRHEMAVIMAKLVLGVDTADNYVGTHPFTDVVPWADKYVAACYENELVYGTSATTFGGSNPLTAVQAAAMMLRALGYKDLNKGYQGDWRAPITAKANEIRLFSGVASNPNEKLDRNQVAQLALNTLKSPMVTLVDGTFTATDGNGQLIISGGSRQYKVIARSDAYAQAISAVEYQGSGSEGIDGYTVELGEHLYNGKLRLNSNDTDDFGRPARTWEYDGKTIGSYMKEELIKASYTLGVSGKTIYDLLGSSVVTGKNAYDIEIYMDGLQYEPADSAYLFTQADINRSNNKDLPGTGRGVLTQVFVDNANKEVTIALINTYLAIADADYNEKRDLASFDVYHLSKISKNLVRTAGQSVNLDIKAEDIAEAANVKDGDAYLVTVAAGKVQTLVPDEIITETAVQAFSTRTDSKYVEVDGAKYNFALTLMYDVNTMANYTGNAGATNLKDIRYNVYLDAYGNAIGVKEVDAVKNYVFITGVDANYSFLASTNYKANAIFLDGTMDTITIDARKSSEFSKYLAATNAGDQITSVATRPSYFISSGNLEATVNTWCTYTKNSSGVYTVELVNYGGIAGKLGQYHDNGNTNDLIDSKNYDLYGADVNPVGNNDYRTVYANNDSVFLTASIREFVTETGADKDIVIDDVDGVATGIDNVKIDVWDSTKTNTAATDHVPGVPSDHRHNESYGSYVLYNDKGYIIAAVVVGDDGGTNAEYVYVHKSGVEERDLGGDDRQWTRTVLLNGEEITLTEIDDSAIGDIDDMDTYKWYRVTFKSDGTVKDVESFKSTVELSNHVDANGNLIYEDNIPVAWPSLPSGNAATVDVTNISQLIVKGAAGDDVVVYHQRITNAKPTVNNAMTLHVLGTGVAANDGIRIDENVKVWFREFIDNKDSWDDGEGINYLKSVIADLKLNNSNSYNYDIAALIKDGKATTVIIRDMVNNYTTPITPDDAIELDSDASVAQVNEELMNHAKVIIKGANWIPKTSDSSNRLVEIPQGKTLEIKGSFNAVREDVQVHLKGNATEGKLIVGGTYTMNVLTSGAVHYDIDAGSMRILEESTDYADNRSVEINSTVVIHNGLTIQDSTKETVDDTDYTNTAKWIPEVIVTRTGDVTVEAGGVTAIQCSAGAVSPADKVVLTQVIGTMTVNGTVNLGGNYHVGSVNSLHAIRATIMGKLVTKQGLVEITTVTEGTYSQGKDTIKTPTSGDPNFMQITKEMKYQTVNVTADSNGNDAAGSVVTELVAIKNEGSASNTTKYEVGTDSNNVFVEDVKATTQASGTINGVEVSGTLAELAAKADGTTIITLNKDVALTEQLVLKDDVTLDLNGKTISGSTQMLIKTDGDVTIKSSGGKGTIDNGSTAIAAVRVGAAGTVTLENLDVKGSTAVFCTALTENGHGLINLTVRSCSLTNTGTNSAAVVTNGNGRTAQGTMTFVGCEIDGGAANGGLYLPANYNVTITDSNVTGAHGIGVKSGSLTIDGTSMIHGTGDPEQDEAFSNGMYITGAAIGIESNTSYAGNMTITVGSGVTLVSDKTSAIREIIADGQSTQIKTLTYTGATLRSAAGAEDVDLAANVTDTPSTPDESTNE